MGRARRPGDGSEGLSATDDEGRPILFGHDAATAVLATGLADVGTDCEDAVMTDAATPPVLQLRVVVEATDYDEAVAFFRDTLGLPEYLAFAEGHDERVVILDAGRATLEIANPAHKRAIDRVEAGGAESPHIRLAFEVTDTEGVTRRLAAAGGRVVAEPVVTPWQSLNSRLDAPAGVQITLFQELLEGGERAVLDGFATDGERGAPESTE